MKKEDDTNGIDIYKLRGWDYAGMCEILEHAIQRIRDTHIPALFHVEEITQPQGHSTSGSHERYKDGDRLVWEKDWDCVKQMKEWIMENSLADEEELKIIETEAKLLVKDSKQRAWDKYLAPIKEMVAKTVEVIRSNAGENEAVKKIATDLESVREPMRRDILKSLSKVINSGTYKAASLQPVQRFYDELLRENQQLYSNSL
jgi:TPP-dependent pyruvate/acetoin dehydrogenase alpha subunit